MSMDTEKFTLNVVFRLLILFIFGVGVVRIFVLLEHGFSPQVTAVFEGVEAVFERRQKVWRFIDGNFALQHLFALPIRLGYLGYDRRHLGGSLERRATPNN